MITRRVDVFDPAVVTVGRISAGTTNNVIPETAEIEGTIRTVSEAHPDEGPRRRSPRGRRHRRRPRDGGHVEIDVGYPVTVNDGDFAEFSLATATELLGHRSGLAPSSSR